MLRNNFNKVERTVQIEELGIRHTLVICSDMRCIRWHISSAYRLGYFIVNGEHVVLITVQLEF